MPDESVRGGWFEVSAPADNAVATATHLAAALLDHIPTKVDASYSDGTKSGELQVKLGATIIGRKYIHGSGALDISFKGVIRKTVTAADDEVTATLTASGTGGISGVVTMYGYSVSKVGGRT